LQVTITPLTAVHIDALPQTLPRHEQVSGSLQDAGRAAQSVGHAGPWHPG
jgi:hypothetical protein